VDPLLNTVVSNVYDQFRRVSQQLDSKNVNTTYIYDEVNHKTTISFDPTGLNIQSNYWYDQHLRVIQEMDGRGILLITITILLGIKSRSGTEMEIWLLTPMTSKQCFDQDRCIEQSDYHNLRFQQYPLTRTDALGT